MGEGQAPFEALHTEPRSRSSGAVSIVVVVVYPVAQLLAPCVWLLVPHVGGNRPAHAVLEQLSMGKEPGPVVLVKA